MAASGRDSGSHSSTETPLKVVLARRMKVETNSRSLVLRCCNGWRSSQYLSFAIVNMGAMFCWCDARRLLKATVDQFETVSIAGSAPRGKTKEEDEALAQALLADAKYP